MAKLIEPRTLKGFRDFLPEMMIPRERLMDIARRVYRRYGFVPIDTPVLEHLEILTGKGSEETDRQMFRFVDHGGRDVGMRFDLTVPFARFAAQHIGQLGTPFKRYHIAPVWRGENPQAGRFREFVQCDFDTIGTESVVSDIETALVIHELLCELGMERFQLRINHRQILAGLLETLGLQDQATNVLRSIDKLEKIKAQGVVEELSTHGIPAPQIDRILEFASLAGSRDGILARLGSLLANSATGMAGIERLQTIVEALLATGVPEERFRIDVSIARGLDYYTGVVFETILNDLPSIGSVCSGGRYDNLAGLYTKQHLPGIGASLGLDRLLAALEQLGQLPALRTAAEVFVPLFDESRLRDYLKLASLVRSEGLGVELFPEAKKLGQQLKYADQRGFRLALIAGPDELDRGTCQLKNLAHKISTEIPYRDDPQRLIQAIRQALDMADGRCLA
jgi:histidyl-tRNA synthetase